MWCNFLSVCGISGLYLRSVKSVCVYVCVACVCCTCGEGVICAVCVVHVWWVVVYKRVCVIFVLCVV